jgi:hypothetical protein
MMQYGCLLLLELHLLNEHFDKILLEWLDVADEDMVLYAACYKLGCSWFCIEQHYTLGIEPFF